MHRGEVGDSVEKSIDHDNSTDLCKSAEILYACGGGLASQMSVRATSTRLQRRRYGGGG